MEYSASNVSIIIPIHCNTQQSLDWLAECLASAMTQGAEVVVYDDGSLLDVEPLISKYNIIANYGLINKGVSAARNKAVEAATRELIFPLDCDDTLKPGAIATLASMWKGTPVYPDVSKFGDVNEPHFLLLDFDCKNLRDMVGFCSVNVLHSKAQWESLGGWNEKLDFYEDGEYNARLMGTYCGIHYPKPLVNYRIHPGQRTQLYEEKSRDYAIKILQKVRRYDMPCQSCGGVQRRTQSNYPKLVPQPGTTDVNSVASIAGRDMPTVFEGKVLVQYVGGKGQGDHYYQGPVTKTPYRVRYGHVYYVFPDDATDAGSNKPWFFIRIPGKEVSQQSVPQPAAEAMVVPAPARMPTKGITRTPVTDPSVVDLDKVNVDSIMHEEFTVEQAKNLLKQEQAGKNRVGYVAKFMDIINRGG